MQAVIDYISSNLFEGVAIILFGIGFTTLFLHPNLIKKIMGLNIMDSSVYLFLAAKGYVFARKAPIVTNGVTDMESYINPIPTGLVLTGIVVSVSVTAVMLASPSGFTGVTTLWRWMRSCRSSGRRASDGFFYKFPDVLHYHLPYERCHLLGP